MKSLSLVLLFAFVLISWTKTESIHDVARSSIMAEFINKPTKDLFKVWHFIFNKEYDYNTDEGIKKYKTFRDKVKEIKEHNASSSTFKMGLNHLSDMTFEEIKEHYNLYPKTAQEIENMYKGEGSIEIKKFTLDDYQEEEEPSIQVKPNPNPNPKGKPNPNPKAKYSTVYDWTSFFLEPRDQGSCGSCWAFSSMGAIEGIYNKNQNSVLSYYFSVQQLMDCNRHRYSCKGGWFDAMALFKKQFIMKDADYPYIAKRQRCRYDKTNTTNINIKGFTTAVTPDATYALLANGPMAVAVEVTNSFSSYSSGIWTDKCNKTVNHGVVLAGYGYDSTTSQNYWLIRNSWGTSWGEKGYIRILDDPSNNGSCSLTTYAYQPNF